MKPAASSDIAGGLPLSRLLAAAFAKSAATCGRPARGGCVAECGHQPSFKELAKSSRSNAPSCMLTLYISAVPLLTIHLILDEIVAHLLEVNAARASVPNRRRRVMQQMPEFGN
jgi:hypothetical protein